MYSVAARYPGSLNYNPGQSAAVPLVINKANATVVITPYEVTYDGHAHTASIASITGVNGESGAAVGTVDVGHTTHTNAGMYSVDYWTFTGAGNYNDIATTTITDIINKADPSLNWITPAPITLGTPLGATQLSASASFQGNPLAGSFAYDPAAGTVLAVGTQTLKATFTPTDTTNFNAGGQVQTTINVMYSTTCIVFGQPSHTILQPINSDGSSVNKAGSTVPAKFRVADANCNSVGTPGVVTSFKLIGQMSDTNTVVNEEVVSTTPDTAFRWDPTAQQWIFNISTKGMKAGQKYMYRITLNDNSTIDFSFALK